MNKAPNIAPSQNPEPSSTSWDDLATVSNDIFNPAESENNSEDLNPREEKDSATSSIEADPDLLNRINEVYEEKHSRSDIQVAFDASSDLEKTMELGLSCDILDEDWAPIYDKEYQPPETIAEKKAVVEQQIAYIDSFMSLPDDDRRRDYLNQLEKKRRSAQAFYVEVQKAFENNLEDPITKERIKHWRDQVVELRTEEFYLNNPDLENERKIAQRNLDSYAWQEFIKTPRYREAISEVNTEEVHKNFDSILERIPEAKLKSLASKINPDGSVNKRFERAARNLLIKALGLSGYSIKYSNLPVEEGTVCPLGQCRSNTDGSATVSIKENLQSDAVKYANTLAHELTHARQDKAIFHSPNSKNGEFYSFCHAYYISSDDNYEKYRHQYIEEEAFYFGDKFAERLASARDSVQKKKKGSPKQAIY